MIRDSSGICVAAEPVGVAAAVDVLVVVRDPTRLLLELGRRDDRVADVHVSAHRADSSSSSGPGFRRIASATPIFPTSCRRPGEAEPLDLVGVEAKLLADQDAELRNGLAVVARARVLRVDRAGERRREQPLLMSSRALLGRRGRLRREAVGVDDDPASGALGLVEGEVGMADQRLAALEASSTRRRRR